MCVEGGDEHEALIEKLVDADFVGLNSQHHVFCEGGRRVSQKPNRLQQGVDEHGLEHVQLKVPVAARDRNPHMVAHHLHAAAQPSLPQHSLCYVCENNALALLRVHVSGANRQQSADVLQQRAETYPESIEGRDASLTWAQTMVKASHCVGLTLPGMMLLPGSFSGSLSSPSPHLGPEPRNRMSLAICMYDILCQVFLTLSCHCKAYCLEAGYDPDAEQIYELVQSTPDPPAQDSEAIGMHVSVGMHVPFVHWSSAVAIAGIYNGIWRGWHLSVSRMKSAGWTTAPS